MYDDRDYASTRLDGTIVLANGLPVYVLETVEHDGELCIVHNDGDDERQLTPLSQVEIKNFKLGFVNRDGNACYVERKALRRDWRQGLRTNNCNMVIIGSGQVRPSNKTIMKCLEHSYPTAQEAYERVLNHYYGSMAFSPEFAVARSRNGLYLSHRARHKVGFFDKDGNLTIAEKYVFLLRKFGGLLNDSFSVSEAQAKSVAA